MAGCPRLVVVASWVLVALAVVGRAPTAAAEPSHTCVAGEVDVEVDGMLDDWDGVAKARVGGNNADASYDLYCLYDAQHLALAFDVRDDRVVRVGKGPAREDVIELSLDAGGGRWQLLAWPGTAGVRPRRGAGAGGKQAVPRGVRIEDSLRPRGFAVEVVIPLARLPGYSAGTAALRASLVFRDADQAATGTPEPIEFVGTIALGGQKDLLTDFLRAVRAQPGDVKVDLQADVDPRHAGKERVVVAGTAVGVLTDRFVYTTLAAASPADVRRATVLDLGGGRVIAAVVHQAGVGADAGSRELLVLLAVAGGAITPILTVEIGKALAGRSLTSSWKVEPRGKGRELVVTAGPAVGWDEETFAEAPAPGLHPIHLPWDEDRWGTAFWLERGELRSRPLPLPKRR
ncbi:MAG: hypothetical protein KBG28_01155 [Kofleriaceae bacterium]|jgi:hypothetical protein|nr:hypothetical protein [Kofleriaceae bacterium]MBP6841480.1 hypothetical protein [Kofleriaceae bacterium]MBP9202559.1 hypothetical protein [Kofleriaceae bacterium]